MKRRAVVAGAIAALAGCQNTVLSKPDARAAEQRLLEQLNSARTDAGRGALPMVEQLRDAARSHSRDMAERDFYAHENPDGQGATERAGCRAGEVIHRGDIGSVRNQGDPTRWVTNDADGIANFVMAGWLGSDSHTDLLMRPDWRGIGVGVFVDGRQEFFATAVFC